MKKTKLFLTRRFSKDFVNYLHKHDIDFSMWDKPAPPTTQEIIDHSKDHNALMTMLSDQIDKDTIAKLSHIKIIANYAVGYNNIDIDAAAKQKIAVVNTPDVLTEATADLALLLTLGVARRVREMISHVEDGEWSTWSPELLLGNDLRDKTLGVIGMGRIGHRYAQKMASAFSMNVIYANRNENEKHNKEFGTYNHSINDLLKASDVVSLHLPYTADNHQFFNQEKFKLMKSSAFFINTARGALVKQKDLEHALSSGEIKAAGLDVTDPEPISKDHPLVALKNCLIFPHNGSATLETRIEMAELCFSSIKNYFEGKKLTNQVNSFSN